MSCVCVHLPAIGVNAVWLDALLPLQFPCNKRKMAVNLTLHGVFIRISLCVCVCVCALSLTLDVNLLHLINLCDSLPELLSKLPELFSTRGAEAHQLLLL